MGFHAGVTAAVLLPHSGEVCYWAYALTINDLAQVLPNAVQDSTGELLQEWSESWEDLAASKDSLDHIIRALDAARDQTLVLLHSLE